MRPNPPSSLLRCAASAAAAILAASSALAQAAPTVLATPTVRVTAPVANDTLVTLKGNTHPLAQAKFDQGAASPSLATGKMQLLLRRSPAQAEALREYMGGLQDPNSPNYHKWLTPAAYGASFGIAPQDLQAVEAWLGSEGFKVEGVPASGNLIEFSGTLGQVAQAFHTSVHSYLIHGEKHYSNASDPQIPAALAPVIAGISPLNDFRAKPMHVLGNRVQAQAEAGRLQVTAQAGQGAKASLTGPIGNTPYLLVTPADAATIYDSPNSTLNRHYTGSTSFNGAGVNIGIANYSNLATADYLNYRKLFLNDTSGVTPTVVVDGVDPGVLTDGNGTEALIDTEFASGLAPNANIYLYTAASELFQDGLGDAIIRAVEDNTVSLLSVSYGQCEAFLGQSGNQFYYEIWQEAAAQGITVTVSTGDSGSAACDAGDADGTPASDGLTVSGIASTPFDVAVGGTDFDTLVDNFAQYVATSANGTAGTAPYFGSALGYIPENPWNDSISNNPVSTYNTNVAAQYNDGSGGPTFTILAAGGGGPSSAAVCTETDQNGNCLFPGYAAPPFQSGISVGSAAPAGPRYTPDVALFASPGNLHPAAWALCSDSVTDGDTTQSYTDCLTTGPTFSVEPVGGTSTSSPAFAGMLGVLIQSLGSGTRLGTANNVLYNLQAGNPNSANIFHDITAGNNSVPCLSGSPNCVAAGDGDTFLSGYNAAPGYDLATGLGSVDLALLVNAWPSANFTPTTVNLLANSSTNPINITHGAQVTLASVVSPSSATGNVAVTSVAGPGVPDVEDYITLTSGAGSVFATNLPGGSYNIQAFYGGDVTHSPNTSNQIAVTVNPEPSNPFLTVFFEDAGTGQTLGNPVPYGAAGAAQVQPGNTNAQSNGYHGVATGQVTLFNNGAPYGAPQTLNAQGIAEFDFENLAPGSYSFTASYAGDRSYNASGPSAAIPVSIVKAGTVIAVQASSTTIAASASTTVQVELATDSIGANPTGPVTLTANGNSFPGTVTAGATQTGTDALFVSFTVPGSALAAGVNTLTASYGGDANYTGSTGTATITVSGGTGSTPAFSLAGPSAGINVAAPGDSGTGTVTITPTNGFTGAVSLTCTVQFSGTVAPPTCSVPASVTVSAGTAATVTVTINTTGQSSSLAAPHRGGPAQIRGLLAAGGGVALCSLLLFGIPARRRSWQSMLLALVAVGVLGVIGCGGTSTNRNETSTGPYTATVTGTSGSVTSNAQISINVQ